MNERHKTRWAEILHLENDESVSKPSKVCGDHGVKEGSTCTCQPGWVGDLCQYKTNCESDDDCNKVEPPRLRHLRWGIVTSQCDFCHIAGSRRVYSRWQRCVQTRRVLLLRRMAGPDQPSTDISWRSKFDVSCWLISFGNFLTGNPGQQLWAWERVGAGCSRLWQIWLQGVTDQEKLFGYLDNGPILGGWHVNWPLRWRICLRESSCSGGNMKMRWEKIEATATYDGWQLGDGKIYNI